MNQMIQQYKAPIIIVIGLLIVGFVMYMNTRIMADLNEDEKAKTDLSDAINEADTEAVAKKTPARRTDRDISETPMVLEKRKADLKIEDVSGSEGVIWQKPLDSPILVN